MTQSAPVPTKNCNKADFSKTKKTAILFFV